MKVGYSQSLRTGYNGDQTISEYGKTLEPPKERSELGALFMTGMFVTFMSLFVLPLLSDVFEFEWAQGLSSLDRPVILASVALGFVFGMRSAVTAAMHNASVHRGEMKDWERGVICRRCGHRFSR